MRWLTSVLSLLVLSCFSLHAQRVSFGVKSGLTALNGFNGSPTHSETRIYTLGPTVELKLFRSLAIEADVLYHRMGYTLSTESFGLTYITRMRTNAWDIAALLKHYASQSGVRPYVAGGLALRTFSGIAGTRQTFGHLPYTGAVVDTTSPMEAKYLLEKDSVGPTAGAGLQFKAGRLRIGPEVRYTRWLNRSVDLQGSQYNSGGFRPLFSSQNQIDFLLGLTF